MDTFPPWDTGRFDPAIDTSSPNPARIYDYLLGGAHNFAADRKAADAMMAASGGSPVPARTNRSFLRRAVQFMIDQGIDQFLDLGSGIPTVGNVHEVAQHANPAARVVYVDNEAVAVAHARQLLRGNEYAAMVAADLCDVDAVLGAADTRRLIDLNRPVGLLMVAVLHFIPDQRGPAGLIGRYLDRVPAGSFLALSHYSEDNHSEKRLRGSAEGRTQYKKRTSTPLLSRSRAQLAQLLSGVDLVDPGIVWAPHWRPDGGDPPRVDGDLLEVYAALGRAPERRAS